MPLSRALAGVFEPNTFELKNHHVRPLVNGWANWGAAGVLDIFAVRNAVAAPRVAAAFVAVSPRAAQCRRLPRPVGSRLPAWLNGCVVDLTV
jgi:hypothetical protein